MVKVFCQVALGPSLRVVEAYTHSLQITEPFVAEMEVNKMDYKDWANAQREDSIIGSVVRHLLMKILGKYNIRPTDSYTLKILVRQQFQLMLMQGVAYRNVKDPNLMFITCSWCFHLVFS